MTLLGTRITRRGTRRMKVLEYLQSRPYQWIPGYVLASQEVGGSEGLRRVRELRQDGYGIEERTMAGSDASEYRYVPYTGAYS